MDTQRRSLARSVRRVESAVGTACRARDLYKLFYRLRYLGQKAEEIRARAVEEGHTLKYIQSIDLDLKTISRLSRQVAFSLDEANFYEAPSPITAEDLQEVKEIENWPDQEGWSSDS